MIFRLWHGWAAPDEAGAYERLLNGTVAPAIMARRVTGLRELTTLRRAARETDDHSTEFATLMRFDSWAAVRSFTGGDPSASVVPAAARDLLSRFDEHSVHYELLHRHLPPPD